MSPLFLFFVYRVVYDIFLSEIYFYCDHKTSSYNLREFLDEKNEKVLGFLKVFCQVHLLPFWDDITAFLLFLSLAIQAKVVIVFQFILVNLTFFERCRVIRNKCRSQYSTWSNSLNMK